MSFSRSQLIAAAAGKKPKDNGMTAKDIKTFLKENSDEKKSVINRMKRAELNSALQDYLDKNLGDEGDEEFEDEEFEDEEFEDEEFEDEEFEDEEFEDEEFEDENKKLYQSVRDGDVKAFIDSVNKSFDINWDKILISAIQCNCIDIINMALMENINLDGGLLEATRENKREIVELLVDNGANNLEEASVLAYDQKNEDLFEYFSNLF